MAEVDRLTGLIGFSGCKIPVLCASTANLTLSGEQTIDGILTSGSRVLVKDQTTTVENGIYVSDSGAWSLAPDADGPYDWVFGTLVPIASGTVNGAAVFRQTTTGTIIPGTTSLAFSSMGLLSVPISIANGGTGAITAAAARTALGVPSNAEAILDSLLTTTGDIIYASAANTPARLGAGTINHVLTSGGAGVAPSWAAITIPSTVFRSYLAGCGIANGTDTTNDINVAAGTCVDSTNAATIVLTALAGKQLDANWAPGAAAGMRNSAAAITNTTYHIYAVATAAQVAAGTTGDVYAHTSTTVATVITALQAESGGGSYIYARRIASIVRAGATILQFVQNGDYFRLNTPVLDLTNATPGTSANTLTLASIPTGIVIFAEMNIKHVQGSPLVYFSPLDAVDLAPSGTVAPLSQYSADSSGGISSSTSSVVVVKTNTSAQIRYRAGTNTQIYGVTVGWTDRRGRDD